jgi:succinoglycan biosynthesis protein ExoA
MINLFSLVTGFAIHPYFFLPIVGYGFALLVGGIVIGKSTREKLTLPLVLATMHMSWGLGFLTSPSGLLAESEAD